jgi:hypothetical protein
VRLSEWIASILFYYSIWLLNSLTDPSNGYHSSSPLCAWAPGVNSLAQEPQQLISSSSLLSPLSFTVTPWNFQFQDVNRKKKN